MDRRASEPPAERLAAIEQEGEADHRPEDHAHEPGQQRQRAEHGRREEGGRPSGGESRGPAGEEVVAPDQRQDRKHQERRVAERPGGRLGERQRERGGARGPAGQEARIEARVEPGGEIPRDEEDRKPEGGRAERPGDPQGVERAETRRGEQQRVEGRPEAGEGAPVEVGEALARQQVPRGGQVVERVEVEPDPVLRLPREDQRNAERRRRERDQQAAGEAPPRTLRRRGVSHGAAGGRRGRQRGRRRAAR